MAVPLSSDYHRKLILGVEQELQRALPIDEQVITESMVRKEIKDQALEVEASHFNCASTIKTDSSLIGVETINTQLL